MSMRVGTDTWWEEKPQSVDLTGVLRGQVDCPDTETSQTLPAGGEALSLLAWQIYSPYR